MIAAASAVAVASKLNLDTPFVVPQLNQAQMAADPLLNADMNQVPTPAREQTVTPLAHAATKQHTSVAFDHSATHMGFAQQ